MLMQGIATIGPSFAILASFVFIVSFAGLVTPWAYLFGGIILGLQALSAAQLAKVFPSAGGWYTWIARAFHPRAGFFAGVLFSIWLPPVATLTMSFLAKTVLEPSIKAEYGVDVPWWIWVVAGVALVVFFAYQGISISEKALIITGLIEIVIMVALAFTGLASPGPGGFSFGPLYPGNFGLAGNLFLGVVFSIFVFRGWEATGVLPKMVGKVNPTRKTPVNAISLQVGVQVLAFVCVLIWGAEDVFFSWANAITIGLVLMYVLCNIGVVRYYLTEGRAQFNPLLHIVVPVIASAAGVVVVWKSYFSPLDRKSTRLNPV